MVHAFTVDGPLSMTGAIGERSMLIKSFPGNQSNVHGAEGEYLVGKQYGVERALGTEQYQGANQSRTTDFQSSDTIRKFNAVFEAKNKGYVFDERGGQITDAANFANSQGADLWVFVRPGARVAGTVSGISNVRILPIPQQPHVSVPPTVFPEHRQSAPPK